MRAKVGRMGVWWRGCGAAVTAALLGGCATHVVESAFAEDFDCYSEVTVEDESGRYVARGCGRTASYQCVQVGYQSLCAVQHFDNGGESASASSRESSPQPLRPQVAAGPSVRVEDKSGEAILKLELRLDESALLKLTAAPDKQNHIVQLKLVRREKSEEADACSLDFMVNGQVLKVPKSISSRDGNVLSQRVQVGREIINELAIAEKLALRSCKERFGLSRAQMQQVRDFMERYQEEMAWKGTPREGGTAGMLAPTGGWPIWVPEGAATPAVAGEPLDATSLFKKLSASVFKLEASRAEGTAQGSAVAVNAKELVTNCHVVQGAIKLVLKQDKMEWPARVVRADPKTDRCVITSDHPKMIAVAGIRSYDSVQVGERVYTLGSPVGLELTLSDGLISGRRESEGFHYVQTTAPISPGSSGGGLFDARGNLIGVTTLVLAGRERLNQALNFAIPADTFWQK